MTRAKQNSLLLLFVAGLLTIILAMSLPDLTLLPGQPFLPGQPLPELPGGIGAFSDSHFMIRIFQGILALGVLLLPIYILYCLLTSEGRQRFIAQVLVLALLLFMVDYLRKLPRDASVDQQESNVDSPQNPEQMAESNPATLLPENPPAVFALVVILVGAALIATLSGAVLWSVLRQRRSPPLVFAKLAEEARNAMVSIHAGGNFAATIMRCYEKMSQVLQEENGITRPMFMTPREFEARLVSKGFPQQSLSTLTGLFEQARYSSIPAGTQEQNLALACLTDIIGACKAMGGSIEHP